LRDRADDHALVKRYLQGTRFAGGKEHPGGRRVGWYEPYEKLWRAREIADYEMDEFPERLRRLFEERQRELAKLRQLVETFVK